ncbi:MAG: LysM peptidoglycan-binding domain-containing protein [Thermoleophilia bacterium]
MRSLAVVALAAAVLTVGIITINSGMFSRGSRTSTGVDDTIGAAASTTSVASEAAAETPSSGTTPAGSRSHVVAAGDSFYTISRDYDTSIAAIQQLNPNLDPSNLTPGTRVAIP